MIKGPIQEDDITIVNIYAPNRGAPQYIRQILTAIKGEINGNTIIVGDFNTPLSPMDTSSKMKIGLPWWSSGWESACQCRGPGFEPWSGKIPHAVEQLGPWATITEPAHLEPVLRNGRGRDSERPAQRDEEWPPLATTREGPRTETTTPPKKSHK